jgi:DNA-binding NarL/FixJ family response regulator
MRKEKIHLILIDDDLSFKEKISLIAQHEETIKILFETSNESELIEYLNSKSKLPDIVLIGINSTAINGIELTKLFRNNYPSVKTIAISLKLEDTLTSNIYLFDADSYLTKSDSNEEILQTIKLVAEKGFYYKESFIKFIRDNHPKFTLINNKESQSSLFTKRELQVLDLICKQKTTQEISKQLFLSPRTVDGHRNNMMLKTGSKNVAGLIVYIFQNNLLDINNN